jgi:hypothetical protein
MSKWLVVAPSGEVTVREDEPTLEALQATVAGLIEALPSPIAGVSVFVNEDRVDWRSMQPLLLNPKATTLMKDSLWPGQRIVGALVLAGSADDEGELNDLSDEQVASLRERLT